MYGSIKARRAGEACESDSLMNVKKREKKKKKKKIIITKQCAASAAISVIRCS